MQVLTEYDQPRREKKGRWSSLEDCGYMNERIELFINNRQKPIPKLITPYQEQTEK